MLGNGRPAVSPHEQPVAIASLAKVMTAYLILERYPLSGAQDGFTITVSPTQARAVAQDRAEVVQSVSPASGMSTTAAQRGGWPRRDADDHRRPLPPAPNPASAQP